MRLPDSLVAALVRVVLASLGSTWRLVAIEGEEHLDDLRQGRTGPVIFTAWHDRMFYFAHYFRHQLLARGVPMTILASPSRDADIGAHLIRPWGMGMVRGSSSRGGREALHRLQDVLSKEKVSVIALPDGPKGPPHRAKEGVLTLARRSGRPLLPVTWATDRSWRAPSWDRMEVPLPFARAAIVVGEPMTIERVHGREAREARRRAFGERLDHLGERAEELLAETIGRP